MKRNNHLNVRFSREEIDAIKNKADKCGMELSSYCRFILLKAEPKIEKVEF